MSERWQHIADFDKVKDEQGTQLLCSECGQSQYRHPIGPCCTNGHFNYKGVTRYPVEKEAKEMNRPTKRISHNQRRIQPKKLSPKEQAKRDKEKAQKARALEIRNQQANVKTRGQGQSKAK